MDRRLLDEARGERAALTGTVLLQAAAGLCLLGYAFALSRAIDRLFLEQAALDDVAGLLALAAICALARAGLVWGAQQVAAHASIRVRLGLRRRLLDHLVALGPAYAQGERTGELVASATRGIDALDPFFRDYLPALVTAAVVPLTYLAVVLSLDLTTFLVLLVTAPLIPLFMFLIGKAAGALARRQYAGLSFLSAHFLDVMQGLSTLKLLNRSRCQIATIARIADEFRSATMGVLRVAFLSALVLEMLATVSVAIVAVEIGLRLLYGRMDFGDALFLLMLAPEYYQPLRTLGARFHAGTEASAAAGRLFEVLETPAPARPGAPAPVPADLTLRFENVSYAFEDGRRPALDGVSFEVGQGRHVALVGESGGGKSTVAALLLKFAAPDAGRITAGGVDLAALDAGAWRSRIGWVSQAPSLFHATVADNIRLGRAGASQDEVIKAAMAAEAHEFILTLPQGYDTLAGERGARLSGGQRQRIAIARAFLQDAPLLVLDETTAYLDAAAEDAIQRALQRLLVGRTALVIAHRLETIRDLDEIVVLQDGRVVERGSHATLLAQAGAYHALVAARGASDG